MNDREKLSKDVERQAYRLKKAEKEQRTVLAQTIFLGTLGLVFVLPVVAGAYLGHWLDTMMKGYSIRWTLSFLFLGLVIGAMNVWLLLKEH